MPSLAVARVPMYANVRVPACRDRGRRQTWSCLAAGPARVVRRNSRFRRSLDLVSGFLTGEARLAAGPRCSVRACGAPLARHPAARCRRAAIAARLGREAGLGLRHRGCKRAWELPRPWCQRLCRGRKLASRARRTARRDQWAGSLALRPAVGRLTGPEARRRVPPPRLRISSWRRSDSDIRLRSSRLRFSILSSSSSCPESQSP